VYVWADGVFLQARMEGHGGCMLVLIGATPEGKKDYDFPAVPWDHLRTTNPIESVFASVRHRTVRTKGSLSPTTARLMVFKLIIAASKTWRWLKGTNQLPKLVAGVRLNDGIEVIQMLANHAA
jgi:putative transposase